MSKALRHMSEMERDNAVLRRIADTNKDHKGNGFWAAVDYFNRKLRIKMGLPVLIVKD